MNTLVNVSQQVIDAEERHLKNIEAILNSQLPSNMRLEQIQQQLHSIRHERYSLLHFEHVDNQASIA